MKALHLEYINCPVYYADVWFLGDSVGAVCYVTHHWRKRIGNYDCLILLVHLRSDSIWNAFTNTIVWRASEITGRKGGFSLPVLLFVDISFIFWEASRPGLSPPSTGMCTSPTQEDVDEIFFLNVTLCFWLLWRWIITTVTLLSCRAFSRFVGGFCVSRLGVGTDGWESQSLLLSPARTISFFFVTYDVWLICSAHISNSIRLLNNSCSSSLWGVG